MIVFGFSAKATYPVIEYLFTSRNRSQYMTVHEVPVQSPSYDFMESVIQQAQEVFSYKFC